MVFNIGSASVISPIAQGKIIIIVKKNEKDNLFTAVSLSFLASDAAIAGTSAVQKAAFIASGNLIMVSIFDTIPDNCIAFASNAAFPPSNP